MALNSDCRHFPGDRPCHFNKAYGQLCDTCQHYQTAGERILFVKLAAAGDVLRTTSLLPAIKGLFPDSFIVWLTAKSSAPLLMGNPNIDEIWTVEEHVPSRLLAEEFDMVLNPDADKTSAALASLATAKEKRGLLLDKSGTLICANPEAQHWLEMGAFDQLKKANDKTYAALIAKMLRLPYQAQPPTLSLTASECQEGVQFLQGQGWDPTVPLIGINVGGGTRWKKKVWKENHFTALGRKILEETDAAILWIGGSYETELLQRIRHQMNNPVRILFCQQPAGPRQTAALISRCALLVTGDTLCLHLATASRIPVVLLIGPTSAAELDLYGRGEKIVAPIACTGCYLPDCEIDPDCMELITPEVVFAAMERTLAAHRDPDLRLAAKP